MKIVKRDGHIVDYDPSKIETAIKKANVEVRPKERATENEIQEIIKYIEDYPDLAEEVIREYGYEHIQPTMLKTAKITMGGLNEEQQKIANFKTLLTGYGFNEIITYSFVSEKEYDLFYNIRKNICQGICKILYYNFKPYIEICQQR